MVIAAYCCSHYEMVEKCVKHISSRTSDGKKRLGFSGEIDDMRVGRTASIPAGQMLRLQPVLHLNFQENHLLIINDHPCKTKNLDLTQRGNQL